MQTLCFTTWESGRSTSDFPLNSKLPAIVDRYAPGQITWGSDPKRGRAIQRTRWRKRFEANRSAFIAFFPLIQSELTPDDWRALSRALSLEDFTPKLGGLVLYSTPDGRSAWIHPTLEADLVSKALSIGATVQP